MTSLHHRNDLATVNEATEAFSVYLAILFALHQLIPPSEQEVSRDELEPRSKRVCGVFKHCLEFRLVDVFVIPDFV